jgi:hypothetical protein
MLKKLMEEMKEMVIKLKQELHDLLIENGSTMEMVSNVTNMLIVNYFVMTLMFNVIRVSKVVCKMVWILFHPFLFSIIKGLYVTTISIVQKRIIMH